METKHAQKDPNHQPDPNRQSKQAKRSHHHYNPNYQLFRSLQEYRRYLVEMDMTKSYLLTPGLLKHRPLPIRHRQRCRLLMNLPSLVMIRSALARS